MRLTHFPPERFIPVDICGAGNERIVQRLRAKVEELVRARGGKTARHVTKVRELAVSGRSRRSVESDTQHQSATGKNRVGSHSRQRSLHRRPGFNFCKNDVFAWDEAAGRPVVVNPYKFILGCDACMQICPVDAITFPSQQELRRVIRLATEPSNLPHLVHIDGR